MIEIIDYIDGAVLTQMKLQDNENYKICRENLEGAIEQLIDEKKIFIK